MAKDYISYWKPQTADRQLEVGGLMEHAASEQFRIVEPGDTLWIVTAWRGGYLTLLGRLVVDEIADHRRAAEVLGTEDLWEASYHALAAPGTSEPLREVDLSDLAPLLRFESERDRLDVREGRVNAKQLQSMRRLTPEAAGLLRSRWAEDAEYARALGAITAATGAGFGHPADNREVERAAVDLVTALLQEEGWEVTSVEAQRIGYDLLCRRHEDERHFEVKGVRGAVPAFMITEGERQRALADPIFELAVVTEAMSPRRALLRFDRDEFLARYDLVPLAYRAVPIEGETD